MKRKFAFMLAVITALVFLLPSTTNAQEEKEIEKKVEKRIKIVTVDESGKETVIDTVLTGDEDIKGIFLGKDLKWVTEEDKGQKTLKARRGNIFILSEDGDKKINVYTTGDNKFSTDNEDIYMIKKGDKGNFSIVTVGEEDAGGSKNIMIHIDEDVVYSKDGEVIMETTKGKSHAYVVKAGKEDKVFEWVEENEGLEEGQVHIIIHSRNEVEDLVINGDAVITIKDGKVRVEGDGIEMNTIEGSKSKEEKGKKTKK